MKNIIIQGFLFLIISMAHGQNVSKKTNIILILADDLGYGDLSSYGQERWKTPRLDQLAAEGAKLTHAYTPMPYCAPTRASLLTGRYPQRHKLVKNPFPETNRTSFQTFRGSDSLGLNPSELLLSEVLKSQGYATKIIGKWHLGHRPQYLPTRHGFDEYYGIPYSNDMRPVKLLENEKTVEYPVVQATLTKRYTESALAFIDKNKDKPFFLYLPHAMPHKPLAVSEEFYTPETKGDLYGDAMRELDWSVGQILDKLKAENLDENTIIIFTSDNGPWFGGSSGGLRGMKAENWEGGIRVPLLVRWKGTIPPGQVNAEPTGIIDIFPTLTKALNIPLPKDLVLDGKDILPLLKSSTGKIQPRELYSFFDTKLKTVRSGKWKLHVLSPERIPPLPSDSTWVDPVWPDGVTILAQNEQPKANQHPGIKTGVTATDLMLFDLENDPSEQINVADKYPEVVKRLKEAALNAKFE
ncbi:MAG: sulfatase [Cytophagales bacterium]|nr:sulfatase [Cytophagales bacterium]